MPLFISFSRRTTKDMKRALCQEFQWPHIIYDPEKHLDHNPYPGMMGVCSFIISTCDSVSMCSEAAASGKPLYIVCPTKQNTAQKHMYFVQQLVDLGIARILSDDIDILSHYEYSPLREAEKIARYVKENVL
jgi:mitochondrial fission protein ELM1